MEVLIIISEFIISSYGSIVILLLMCYWLLPVYRQVLKNLIVWLSFYLIIGSIIFVLKSFYSFFRPNVIEYEKYAVVTRITGPYWFLYWVPLTFKGIVPQLLWFKKIRQSIWFPLLFLPISVITLYIPKVHLLLFDDRDFIPVTFSVEIIFVPLLALSILVIVATSLIKRIKAKI